MECKAVDRRVSNFVSNAGIFNANLGSTVNPMVIMVIMGITRVCGSLWYSEDALHTTGNAAGNTANGPANDRANRPRYVSTFRGALSCSTANRLGLGYNGQKHNEGNQIS
jgi:hypothetical protein